MLAPAEAARLDAQHPDGLDESAESTALAEALPRWLDESDRLRVLWAARGHCATKTYTRADDGTIRRGDFDAGYRFSTRPTRTLASVDDVADLLRDLARDPRASLIRGALRAGVNPRAWHRRRKQGDDAAYMPAPCGREWLTFDIDGLPLPDDLDPVRDPRAAAEFARAQLPEPFRSGACCYQLSSSTGFSRVAGAPKGTYRLGHSGTVSLHLMFRAARPIMDRDAEAWVSAVNDATGAKLLDVATLRTVQPYYVAAPILDGVPEPLPLAERIGTLDGAPTVEVPATVPTPGEWWAEQTHALHRREAREAEQRARREAAEAARKQRRADARQRRAEAAERGKSILNVPSDCEDGDGLPDWRQPDLVRYFASRGDLGDMILGREGYAVRCPRGHLHSDGRDGLDGDTAILRNDEGNGWHIVCMHSSCQPMTNRTLRELDPAAYDDVCPCTYYPPPRADSEAERLATTQPARPFALPPIPPGTVPFVEARRDEVASAPDWLDATAGAGGVLDRLRAEQQTAPNLRATARALAANGQRGKAAGILTRQRSAMRFGELDWPGANGTTTATVDNDQFREPRWHALDAFNKGRDEARALLATLGMVRPTTRDDDPSAPLPLTGHVLGARAFVVEADDFGEALAVASETLRWLTPKNRLLDGAGCLALLDRGHSAWAPGGATLPVVLLYTASNAATLDKLANTLGAVTLPPGARWIEPGLVPLRPLEAARLVARVVEAVPKWAATAAAVADDLAHFKGVQLVRRTGALRAAWREPARVAPRVPDDARDVLNLDECERAAEADPVAAFAAIAAWEDNARLHALGGSVRRPVVRLRDATNGAPVDRDDPAIRWRVGQLAVRLETAWQRWCGGARAPADGAARAEVASGNGEGRDDDTS